MTVVIGGQVNMVFSEESNEVRAIMKREAGAAFEKTSGEAKAVLKKQVDDYVATVAPYAVSPVKLSVAHTSSEPVAAVLNTFIDACGEPLSKQVGYYLVDKLIDTAAKKAIDKTIDSSVNSTQFILSRIYTYI